MTSLREKVSFFLDSIVIFKNITDGETLAALRRFVENKSGEISENIRLYCDFVEQLYKHGCDLGKYLYRSVMDDDNIFIRLYAENNGVPEVMETNVKRELEIFEFLSSVPPEEFAAFTGYNGALPEFINSKMNFISDYLKRTENVNKLGYGIFSENNMFFYKNGKIVPLKSSDKRLPENLMGYESERSKVIENTLALINGKPSLNVLLYGDAGTGKSSTVKTVVNMLASEGVRLVEIKKDQISEIPEITEILADNPLKFILFIDDLSFSDDDPSIGTMKAILEGSASARAKNTAIYVTSNRRRLIKESFSSRTGDDVHRRDTMQEISSLSERFGLSILFARPDKKQYIEIVKWLAKQKNINISDDVLVREADAFALSKGGYSPRAAEQYTDSLLSVY